MFSRNRIKKIIDSRDIPEIRVRNKKIKNNEIGVEKGSWVGKQSKKGKTWNPRIGSTTR